MKNNSFFPKTILQLTALFLGAAILTTLTQHSFNSIGTTIDEAVNNRQARTK